MGTRVVIEAIENERLNRKNYPPMPTLGKMIHFLGRDGYEIEGILHIPNSACPKKPAIIECHGGCWFAGDAKLMETFSSYISKKANAVVLNLNYSLVDQTPFPIPQNQIVDAVVYLKEHADELGIDPNKIILCGQSAGANLSLGASILLSEKQISIYGQILVYPYVDFTGNICPKKDPTNRFLENVLEVCTPNFDPKNPIYSPIYLEDERTKLLPKACIITCGKDDLLPHGEQLKEKMENNSVLWDYQLYPDAVHGFLETNREEMKHDNRNSPEQDAMARDCEQYILKLISEIP